MGLRRGEMIEFELTTIIVPQTRPMRDECVLSAYVLDEGIRRTWSASRIEGRAQQRGMERNVEILF